MRVGKNGDTESHTLLLATSRKVPHTETLGPRRDPLGMARLPRSDRPGTWHHVVNRGIAKRPLFESRDDARFFLARLVRQIRLGRIEVHAYCLMTTHFHLLVRSPKGELSEALRRVQNEHSRRFNRTRQRDGALVRGRFFSRPVRSDEYRRVLVAYIDANPVKAGVAASVGGHELGSAAAYLGRFDPPWLSRAWVETAALRLTGAERFDSSVYRAAFGTNGASQIDELHDFVETRSGCSAREDPIEQLVGAAPQQVQDWMQRKAALADGHRVGLPVCGRLALRRALDGQLADEGPWIVEDGRWTWRGAEIAWVGLLRDLCGLSWGEIAAAGDGSIPRARRQGAHHRRLLRASPDYARRSAAVAHAALTRQYGVRHQAARDGEPGVRLRISSSRSY